MDLLKKLTLTIAIILFIISIFKDLTVGTIIQPIEQASTQDETLTEEATDIEKQEKPTESLSHPNATDRYDVISQTIQPGDTVLTIIESINPDKPSIEISQVIQDFEILNPGVNAHQINPSESYLFPVYKN